MNTARTPVLLDGGLATQLEAAGHDLGTPLWSAALLRHNPRAIMAAHAAYVAAGADVLISASYQASRAGLHQLGVSAAHADRLIASSVALAREAAEVANAGAVRVAASVGPYGAVLHDGSEYTGSYGVGEATLCRFHEPRLAVLDEAGADFLAVETIPSLAEARVLAGLLAGCRTPAWVSFSCRDGIHISDGTPLAEAAALFAGHARVFALGINCTPPRYVTALLEGIGRAAPDKDRVAYPNSGETYDARSNRWRGAADTAGFVAAAGEWVAAGAGWVGGCCRIGPGHIAALRGRWPRSKVVAQPPS